MPTRPTPELISALRTTAKRLAKTDVKYQWSHQGSCNCGHLAQTLTNFSQAEIHAAAIERHGDWEDHAEDYCPTSGHHIDAIISGMIAIGMTRDDIGYLEKLDAPAVLLRLPLEQRRLQRGNREHVVLYMNTWAALLEEQLLEQITLPSISFDSFDVEQLDVEQTANLTPDRDPAAFFTSTTQNAHSGDSVHSSALVALHPKL